MGKKKKVPGPVSEPPITRKEIAEVAASLVSMFQTSARSMIPAAVDLAKDLNRIANSLEKLAELERQKML